MHLIFYFMVIFFEVVKEKENNCKNIQLDFYFNEFKQISKKPIPYKYSLSKCDMWVLPVCVFRPMGQLP